jgi:ABC-2 type transport system permease protein
MAELSGATRSAWSSAETRAQYRAIAVLRWQMFRNSFRRKGGKGELIAWIVLIPLLLLVALFIAGCTGAVAGFAVYKNHYEWIAAALWGLFILTQFMNIQLGQPGTTFDPTQLIRFPTGAVNYAVIRFFFGVMSPANMVLMLASIAAAIGMGIANAALWGYALLGMLVFIAVNLLFTRMAFSWIDRWLATRRAREIFTALIFIGSLGFQYLNFTFNPAYHHHEHGHNPAQTMHMVHLAQRAVELVRVLPPGLISKSMASAALAHPVPALANIALTAAYGLLFFAIFAWRMRTEYRGEAITESASGKRARHAVARPTVSAAAQTAQSSVAAAPAPEGSLVLSAVLTKEWTYLRRNVGLLYGLLGPLFFVFIFVAKLATHYSGDWIFQASLAYGLLGVVPVSYNSLGFDGTGAQMYFIVPVRLRDVFLAKNIFNIGLALVEVAAVWAILVGTGHAPHVIAALNAVLWVVATILVELSVGNYRSISAPKKIDLTKGAQKQASPLSALLAMGILLASGGVCYSLQMLTGYVHLPWVMPIVLVAMLAGAAFAYWTNLKELDFYAFSRREALFEELGKKA